MANSDKIENLRLVLEREQGVTVSYGDAEEMSDAILDFYTLLSDNLHNQDNNKKIEAR